MSNDKFIQPMAAAEVVEVGEGGTLLPDSVLEAGRMRVADGEPLDRVAEELTMYELELLAPMFDFHSPYEEEPAKEVGKGGEGSGNWGHAGRPDEIGGSEAGSGGGAAPTSDSEMRALRAKGSYNPATAAKQRLAEANEKRVATAIGGTPLPDNEPFDVLHERHAIEVKTIVDGKNPKITMHPESLARKIKYARANKVKAWTVAIDQRTDPAGVYIKKGLGSFRLKNMEKLEGMKQLRLKFS